MGEKSRRAEVTVLYFGPASDAAGTPRETIAIEPGSSLADLFERLCERHPSLRGRARFLRFALNQEYVDFALPSPGAGEDDRGEAPAESGGEGPALSDGDEVALIPPVAGGVEEPVVELTDGPIDFTRLVESVRADHAGAVCLFLGTVRAEGDAAGPLEALEYTAYKEMASAELRKIAAAVLEDLDLTGVAVAHRLGTMTVGEVSVALAVSAPHRKEAFAGCRRVIDRLKESVPIWQREIWRRKEATWVDPEREG